MLAVAGARDYFLAPMSRQGTVLLCSGSGLGASWFALGAISWRQCHARARQRLRIILHEDVVFEKRCVRRGRGEALPMLKHWKRPAVTNELIGNRAHW